MRKFPFSHTLFFMKWRSLYLPTSQGCCEEYHQNMYNIFKTTSWLPSMQVLLQAICEVGAAAKWPGALRPRPALGPPWYPCQLLHSALGSAISIEVQGSIWPGEPSDEHWPSHCLTWVNSPSLSEKLAFSIK